MSAAILAWVTGDDTGLSSMAIWGHMMGVGASRAYGGVHYPHDPDDFGRCYRLLALAPHWRKRVGEMADYGPEWRALAEAWDELEALYESEVGTSRNKWDHFGKHAHKLYDRMLALIDGARRKGAA